MRRLILFWALLVLLAAPAWGIDTTKYPSTLVDQTCTDTEDTPAATTPARFVIGGRGYHPKPTPQLTGSADGFCDHDSRIVSSKTAIVADTSFGPFELADDITGIYLFVDANTVSGGDSGWRIRVDIFHPHNAELDFLDATTEVTGASDEIYAFWDTTRGAAGQIDEEIDSPLPRPFYLTLDLTGGGATSWEGEISLLTW